MTRQQRITQDVDTLKQFGTLERNGFLIGVDEPTIRVYEVKTQQLVAYSCTGADFEQSLVEFVGDYVA